MIGTATVPAPAAVASSPPTPSTPSFSTYNPQTFTGRDTETADLTARLGGSCRVLAITGMTGLGKTALGQCLASRALERTLSFQWIYLEVWEGQSPDFASVAVELLERLGDRNLDPQERNNPEQLVKRLLQKLQSHSYWIQIDSLERLLNPEQPTEFVDPYWKTFFQQCLTGSNMVSRLVLTTQAFPTDLVEFGDRYPNTWTEIRLRGLSQVEHQMDFFAKRGIVVTPTNQVSLTYIAKTYEGHPLVLKVIAEDILQEFAGDVDRYWQVYRPEFEQVSRELQAICLDEMDYNEALDRKVRDQIRRSLEKLPVDALDLLCRSAVFRRPVPKKFWLTMIGDRSLPQQKVAYQILGDRALIEKEGTNIRQHNLIRAVAYDRLKQDYSRWEVSERQAADTWFDHQQTYTFPKSEFPHLETVHGFLEAFHHYCEIEDWESARKIIAANIKICVDGELVSNCQLHVQLVKWGNYKENINLAIRLIGKVDLESENNLRLSLGNSYYYLEIYNKAIEEYETCLKNSDKIENNRVKCQALSGLSNIHIEAGKYSLAIKLINECMEIAEEIKDIEMKIIAFETLGNIHFEREEYIKSVEFLENAYFLSQDFYGTVIKSAVLGNLARTYFFLDRKQEAFEKLQESIEIIQKTGSKRQLADAVCIAGGFHAEDGNYLQALTLYADALKAYRELQSLSGEMKTLENIGTSYLILKDYEMSLNYFHKSLSIARKTKDFQNTEHLLIKLGQVCITLYKYQEALEYNNLHVKLIQNELALRRDTGNWQFLEQNQGGAAVLSAGVGDGDGVGHSAAKGGSSTDAKVERKSLQA